MNEVELKNRTMDFALRVIRLTQALPASPESSVIRHQLVACGTAVGANYRTACRSRSMKEFAARLAVVEEGADECGFWMDLIMRSGLLKPDRVRALCLEASELTAIMTASQRTARSRAGARNSPNPKSKIENPKSC